MANFCGKCGSHLDKDTGLCPNCDAEQLSAYYKKSVNNEISNSMQDATGRSKKSKHERRIHRKAQKKATKKQLKKNWSRGKKIRRFLLKIFLIVLLLLFVAIGTTGILMYLGIVNIETVKSVFPELEIYSNESTISELYENYNEINNQAIKIEEKYYVNDSVPIEQLSSLLYELSELAEQYKNKGILESYTLEETSIFMKFESGVGYLYTPINKEIMSGDQVGNILTVEPYATSKEFIVHYILGGKSPDKAATKIADALPDLYCFDSEHNRDEFLIEDVERLGNNKILIWYGHGGYTEKYGSVLGTSVSIKNEEALKMYSQELLNGEIILGKDSFCLCPSYFEKHIPEDSLNDSLVYLAACESGRDDRLANVFISKGARLVVGNTRSIFTRYNLYMMYDFLTALTNKYPDGTFWTAEDALKYAKDENGETDGKIVFVGAEVKLFYSNNEKGYCLEPIQSTSVTEKNHSKETKDSYDRYCDAVAKTTESGSWTEQLTLNADMSIAYDGGQTKTTMTLNSNSNISNYTEDDLSQMKISGQTNMKIMGQEYDWSTEYQNGIAQYYYTKPIEKSQTIEIDPTVFDFNSIAYEAILDEESEDKRIHFTVSGDKMTEIGIAALKQISGVDDLQYRDIDVIVILGENENIEEIDMSFSASMKYQGYDADVNYEIQYNFHK